MSPQDAVERGSVGREVTFSGRILLLTEDPGLVSHQLAGADLDWSPELQLRSEISTDEILPVYRMYQFDERLGDYAYEGLRTGGISPVHPGSVRRGGFAVSVSGRRRGKGSSREHAPLSEYHAGIRLVIAESFERIYRENCHDLGIFTSTDFGLIHRIRSSETITIAELLHGLDPLTSSVLAHRGLFPFAKARLQSDPLQPPAAADRAQTLGEKILARHIVLHACSDQVGLRSVKPGDSCFVRTDLRVSHDYITGMAASMLKTYLGSDVRVNEPDSIILFRDHLTFLDEAITPERKAMGLLAAAEELNRAQEQFAEEQGIRLHGEQLDRKGSQGINHNMVLESYALPGSLIASADSHAPHAGAIGCLSIGVGTTAMATSWITRDLRIVVPESAQINIIGQLATNVSAKDLVLFLLQHPVVKAGRLVGKLIEYGGEAVEALDMDERATLTNMAPEIGAFSALVPPDATTADYLARRSGSNAILDTTFPSLKADPDAVYAESLTINAGAIRPMIALPGDPGNGVILEDLVRAVPIDIAFGGSCTGSKASDMDMYARVFHAALAKGKRVAPNVQCFIQAGSMAVRRYCEEMGYLDIFHQSGVRFLEPGCGACCNAGPGVSRHEDQITVASTNRNFSGRSGPGQVYLASPLSVAASAVAGRLTAFRP